MMGRIFIPAITLILFSLIGCQTVPRHLVREQVVIIYYEPIYVDPPYIPDPPYPDLPTTPVTNPKVDNPPPRDLESDNQNNGGSYGKRDPLQGGDNRQPRETKTYPSVKKPERNNRVQ